MPRIRVYHSFRSPYSRLGLHVLSRAGLDVDLIPFTGPPEGNRFDDPLQNKGKTAYYMQDVPRMTMRMRLPIMPPNPFEVDLIPSYKAAVAAHADEKGMAFALAVSDARWGEGKNIADLDVLKHCAKQADWSPEGVEKAQSAVSVGKAMKKHRELIEEDQVFGVPFAVMGDQKYWGHERFALLVEEAAS
ncbi:MAG: DsbA family protein [Pseudomonadota bacterium]